MSKGIYDILGKLASVTPKEEPKQEAKTIYESVEAKGSVLAGVDKVESRLQKQFNESSVSQAQAHMMAGAAHDPAFAKKVGVKQSVAKEFNKADTGKKISKLPKHVEEDGNFGIKTQVSPFVRGKIGRYLQANGLTDVSQLSSEDIDVLSSKLGMSMDTLAELVGFDEVNETESFISDDVWNAAKRLARLHGVDVAELGEHEVNTIADQFGLAPSDVAEILELTGDGVCEQCGMTEGTCEHTQMAEASYVHKGTYGTSYDVGDDDSEDKPKSTEKKAKGRPKKDDSERSSASLPWGGKPPKDKFKHASGGWGMKGGDKFGKVTESINFKKLMDDTNMTVDEMISALQNDIKSFKQTGDMSETLRDFIDLHRHSRKQADEAMVPSPTDIKFATPAITRKAAAPAGDNSWMINQADFDQKDLESPTTHAGLAQRKRDLGIDATHELNELAKLAGLEVKEATATDNNLNGFVQEVAKVLSRNGYENSQDLSYPESVTDVLGNSSLGRQWATYDEETQYDLVDDIANAIYKMNDSVTSESAGANAYEVSVDLYDRDEPVTVTVHTDADLTNCDEDMFRSEIEDCLREQGIDVDEDVAQWDLLNPPEGWTGLSLDEADAPVAQPKTAPVNAPNEKYGTVKQITTQGDDMNRQKKQFASKPFRGDNPMTTELEGKLAEMYDSIKIKK